MSPAADGGQALRLSLLFLAYFTFVGAFTPYLSLYLDDAGMTITQIGVLMSLPQALRIVAPPFWGWLADRTQARVMLLRTSAALSLVGVLAFGLAPHTYGAFALVLAAIFFATGAQMTIGEAMAIGVVQGDAGRYGRMRLWGSAGFIVSVTAMGPLLDAFGVASLPSWMLALAATLLAATLALAEPPAAPRPGRAPGERLRARLREPAILAFLASCFLMIVAHAGLYAFFSLYLEQHGWSKTAIGLAWALGVVLEMAVFRWQQPLFARFGALPLLSFSLAVAAVRFALVGVTDAALWAVVLTQAMHAITFGVHHSAVMALLHRWFAPAQQARAQAVYIMVGYGAGGTVGGLAGGWLWAAVSPEATFLGAGLAALAGWGAVEVCRRLERRG